MSDEPKTNYKALIITGIISLAVAVGGNILVNKLTGEKLLLAYDLVVSETFSSSSGNIRIATISVVNNGSKSIDDVSLNVDFPDGSIQEYKLSGLQPNSYNIDKKTNKLSLSTKFLNPTEEFVVQLLLNNPSKTEFIPFIDLRGRGVLGSQVVKDKKSAFSESVLTALLALATAMAFFTQKSFRKKITGVDFEELRKIKDEVTRGDKHADEQRDVVAYILSVCSLGSYADEIRNIPRKISYWSICDHLTQKWLEADDVRLCENGANALERLIEYAAIADKSVLLIKSNIAKLYKAAGKLDKSQSIVDEIMASESGVIKARVADIDA
jgi:hypothetical protein